MFAAIVSHITKADNAMNGTNPDNLFPGIILLFDGSPKKYLIGPGDFAIKNAAIQVIRVHTIVVTKNDPRDGILSVPINKTTKIC